MTTCGAVRLPAPRRISDLVQKYADALSPSLYAFVCQWIQSADLEKMADDMIESIQQNVDSRNVEKCPTRLDVRTSCPTREAISAFAKCYAANELASSFPIANVIEDILIFYFDVYCGTGTDRKPNKKNLVDLLTDVREYACKYKDTCGKQLPTTPSAGFVETYRWQLLIGGGLSLIVLLFVLYWFMTRDSY